MPVKGIVETGAALLLENLASDPQRVAAIFATQTTIDAGTYPRMLEARGVPASQIVAQACPGLADTISEDRQGEKTRAEIRKWVGAAIAKMPSGSAAVVACLACTHYGYRKDDFAAAFAEAGIRAAVVNPNERAVNDLFPNTAPPQPKASSVEVQFITRYAIPPATIEALTFFLEDIGPKTVAAMKSYVQIADLF